MFFCRLYKLLNVLEFNSTRKRMSVIVRDEEGKLLLLSKGADRFAIIYPKTMEFLFFIPFEYQHYPLSYTVSCLRGLPKMVAVLRMRLGTM